MSPPDKVRGGHRQEAATNSHSPSDAIVQPATDEWPDRLAAQRADHQHRRDRKAADRAILNARRAAGLRVRHAAKLRRGGGRR